MMAQVEKLDSFWEEIVDLREIEEYTRKKRQELEAQARKLFRETLLECQGPDCNLTCEFMLCFDPRWMNL